MARPMMMRIAPDNSRPVQTYHQVRSTSPAGWVRMYHHQTPAQMPMSAPAVMYVRAVRADGLAESGMGMTSSGLVVSDQRARARVVASRSPAPADARSSDGRPAAGE